MVLKYRTMASQSPYNRKYVEKLLGKKFLLRMSERAGQHKWTAALWAKLLHAIYLGLGLTEAAAYAGITPQTLRCWRAEYPELVSTIDQAGPAGCVELAQRLDADDDSLTARWRLERRSASFRPPVRRTESLGEVPPIKIELVEADAQGDAVPVPPEISGEGTEEEEE